MKLTGRATLMVAALALSSSLSAQVLPAASPLTLDYSRHAGDGPGEPSISLLAVGDGYSRFSLDSVRDTHYGGASEGNHTETLGLLGFTIAPGYVVTGFEFNGTLSGSLFVQDASHVAGLISQSIGSATNLVRAQIDIVEYGRNYFSFDRTENDGQWNNITDPENATFGITGAWSGQIGLSTTIFTSAMTTPTFYQAEWGGRWYESRFYSAAGVRIDNPTLTLFYSPVAAVPEPTAWMMFLGGFAVLGFRLRRRYRSSES